MREYTAQEVEHTIQGYPMVNSVHLCDSCSFELPNCEDEKHIIYGSGVGEDNIAACSDYNPVRIRNYEEERFNTIPK